MKSQIHLPGFLFALLIITFSCSKSKSLPMPDRPIEPLPGYMVNREYFWRHYWQKTATGYEMILRSSALTDSAINKGIKVHVAIESEMMPFERLPVTLNYSGYPDTISLSYTPVPGRLNIFAKTSMTLVGPADVFIQY